MLVIDDNADLRENTAEILELAGYRVSTAENGKKGVELALREKPALIVCDIMMPELDGYGVLHLLRKNPETLHIQFIFLTAKTERPDYRKGMEMGADDYITKPFDDIELLNAVETRLKKVRDKPGLSPEETIAAGPGNFSAFMHDLRQQGTISGISEHYDTMSIHRKGLLYAEGKTPRFLYYLISGKIKLYRAHADGKEYITDLLQAGDFIGYSAILKDKPYEESAAVLEDATIMQIPREEFLKMIHTDIGIATRFIQIISQDAKDREDRLLTLAYSSLRKRVAAALLDISDKLQSGRLPLGISREEIAQYIG
ncbi:MAG: response regulator, partial [Chitinophagaceae bacterium]